MGRYVPPDAEGLLTTNQASGKGHALGARASRLKSEGILTVRFEMPFAVWCDTCGGGGGGSSNSNSTEDPEKNPQKKQKPPVLIGQGVRFNAEKKKIGTYYSSPVYSFRMRHAACGGVLEIHTDPKNTAYVVVAGGRKRIDESSRPEDNDSLVAAAAPIRTAQEEAQQRETAFATLEKTIADRAALAASKERIDEMEEASARQWDDPYARNQALRKTFRAGRHARERESAKAEAIKERMGLGIELLPESEEDARRARLVEFGRAPSPSEVGEGGGGGGGGDGRGEAEKAVFSRPLFGGDGGRTKSNEKTVADTDGDKKTAGSKKKPPKKLKSEAVASKRKETLVSEIMGNTRMASDPFLEPRGSREPFKTGSPLLPGLKRKREVGREPSPTTENKPPEKVAIVTSGLVDYDSD